MHVLIAGAGIGGLTAALSLEKLGIEVTVFEKRQDDRAVRGSASISCPHAGAGTDSLSASRTTWTGFAVRTRSMKYFTRRGQARGSACPAANTPVTRGRSTRCTAGELQLLLLETFRQRAAVRTGWLPVMSLRVSDRTGDTVTASFIDPSSKDTLAEVTARPAHRRGRTPFCHQESAVS